MRLSTSKDAVENRHREFELNVAEGMTYSMAFSNSNTDTCNQNAMTLVHKPQVKEMIKNFREEAFEVKKLSRAEKLAYLAGVVRESPAGAIVRMVG